MGFKIGTVIGDLTVVGKLSKDVVLARSNRDGSIRSYAVSALKVELEAFNSCSVEVIKEESVTTCLNVEESVTLPVKVKPRATRVVDSILGKRFHNLVVIEELEGKRVVVRCDCGQEREYTRTQVMQRKTTKCTCNRAKGIKGLRRGMLEVIEDISATKVKVRCDCGNEKDYVKYWFEAGTSTDCGCVRKASRIIEPGTRFRMLTVIEDTGAPKIKARCDCGTVRDYPRSVLVNSGVKNCGCSRVMLDFVGRKFGDYTVIKELGHSKVLARCICGTEKEFNKNYIQTGVVSDCGCKVGRKHYGSLVGKVFKLLTVVEELGMGNVLAQCSCNGNIKEYARHNLISGATGSCGCLRASITPRLIDRTGQSYGRLTIVKELGGNKVLAQCSCNGNIKEYLKNSMVGGHTLSCGCLKRRK